MKKFLHLLFFSTIFFSFHGHSQVCIPSSSCFFDHYVNSVIFSNLSNTNSGGNNCFSNSYIYYPNLQAVVQQGQTYTLSIAPSSLTFQGLAAWIDFNGDNDFNDPGELVFTTSNLTNTTQTTSVTIPLSSVVSSTVRMRIRASDSFIFNTPCQNIPFGETEDYNVLILPGNTPPVADFTSSTTSTCNGLVQFTDLSTLAPTSWLWDFGDATTSTSQNPQHTYTASGSYTVQLIASNANGSDTLTLPNYITVNLSASLTPISCLPATTQPVAGFGITNVLFGGINNPSQNAQNAGGYEDFSCTIANLTAGQTYPIQVTTNQPTTHNTRAWIDWNNDGVLNNTTELVLSANNSLITNGTVSIPSSAVLNTPLRLRISSDYDLQPIPTPCADLVNGQAEDYAVIIQPNTAPPAVAFNADPTTTCDGAVSFTDQSANVPSAWFWEFGDGSTSFQQNPTHTYLSSGTYTVSLIASNLNGSDTLVQTNFVTVNFANQLSPASCSPATGSYCCSYGIYNVSLATINRSSGNASVGYQDYSCTDNTSLVTGSVYTINVQTGLSQNEDVRAWVDYNNDGSFSGAELILSSDGNMAHSAAFTVPSTGVTLNQALRMRVWSDFAGSNPSPCTNPINGQVEDYAVTIFQTLPPPVANFTEDTTITCNGTIQFTDQSQNSPTSWQWNFGDGATSTQQNPQHSYTTPGTYSVILIVTNGSGSDTLSKPNHILYDPNACNSINMPANGTGNLQSGCAGQLHDNGGPGGNYSNNTSSFITIQPPSATSVTLTFSAFAFAVGDYLRIYDGPSASSPLIGQYDGFALPNGGTVTSSGSAITIEQFSNGGTVSGGFSLSWLCSVSQLPVAAFSANETFTCDRIVQFTDQSTGGVTAWAWNFGDGGTSNQQNPQHTYSAPGDYTVSLTVTNPNGMDDSTIIDYITVDTILCLPQQGAGPVQTACSGRVYDNGGISNYLNSSFGSITIAPTGASAVTIDISGFAMGSGTDFIRIHDGPSTSAPLIGTYDNNSPSSFSVTANSGAATIFLNSDALGSAAGFVADWSCQLNPEPPIAFFSADSTTSCTGAINFTDLSTKLPTSWDWDFGDGFSSTQQNPQHTYTTDGFYTVRLIATNALGSDTLTQTDFIHRDKQYCPVSSGPEWRAVSALKAFPNPAEDQLTITYRSEQAERIRVIVFNTLGELMFEKSSFTTGVFRTMLQVDQFPSGIYFVSVIGEKDRKSLKVVVN